MESLQLTLVTPVKKILEGVEVTEIKVPAQKGQLTIYPDHSPLVTTLHTGVLSYIEKGKSETQSAVITWGYCEVIDGEVRLLAETVEMVDQIDVETAKATKSEMEKLLASNTLPPEEIKEAQDKLAKANAEISLSLH